MKGLILFCDSSSGRYIPKRFIEEVDHECLSGVSKGDMKTLKNPDDEWYWEAWDNVLNNAIVTDKHGNTYQLHHDGDLWLYCTELMTTEEVENFFGNMG